ncbi:tyrosine-type recombinase/integrase [Entomomonas asaccharolytica]|uniref:Tyrosine-type recombinase/integrase n=1 Tax=Entomomonas asaccharolytica TaxID=2785331 RepID=A0A974RWC6_9GAMM|nr:tyrosine-type recombinase/integrase [Entomomonas asaccharolytica]QQP85101.1 tyrosine-type recombinase/integrase [Entomomonas asaccharolytica]
MAKKKPENNDLPKRMKKRTKKLKSGKVWLCYYYDGRKDGKRIEISLGQDLEDALIEWAKLEGKKLTPKIRKKDTLGYLFDLYLERIAPTKSPRTQLDYKWEIDQLRKVFEDAPINSIKPHHIAQYRDTRTAKVRANREIARLSHIYNVAIEWGMADFNPVKGVRKNKEKPRDYYAEDHVFYAVLKHASQELKDIMGIAYFTGQRPADVIKIKVSDINPDHLFIGQNKRGHKLRIKLNTDKGRTTLGLLIDNILSRKQDNHPSLVTVNGEGITYAMRRSRFDNARNAAANEALINNNEELADQIKKFQFRDLRPKAATDMDDINLASKLLGHTKQKITELIYIRKGQEVTPLERK